MNNFRKKSTVIVFAVGLFLMSLHFLLNKFLFSAQFSDKNFWLIYLFLTPFTWLILFMVDFNFKRDKTSAGKTFIFFSTLKLFGTLAFLSPWVFFKIFPAKPFTFHFFILFFIFLFLEIRLLTALLNDNSNQNERSDKNQS